MGQRNSKSGYASNIKIDDYTLLRSRDSICIDLKKVAVGVYCVDGLTVYVFHMPTPEHGPNKFWLSNGALELICERDSMDFDMIKKQIAHMRQDKERWNELYKNSFNADE